MQELEELRCKRMMHGAQDALQKEEA